MVSDRLARSIVDQSFEDLPCKAILTANRRITAPIIPVPWINCFGDRIFEQSSLATLHAVFAPPKAIRENRTDELSDHPMTRTRSEAKLPHFK
ncbi:hypothetical protein ACKFKF_03675 [Phormidesmis sp. 146-12]